jgi:hypothetical protein
VLQGWENLAPDEVDQGGGEGGGRLPTLTASPFGFDGEDHLVVPKELKSLTDRSFAHFKAGLDLIEV